MGRLLRLLALVSLLTLSGCVVSNLGFLSSAGPVAAGERHMLQIVAIVMTFLIGPVLLLKPVFA